MMNTTMTNKQAALFAAIQKEKSPGGSNYLLAILETANQFLRWLEDESE